MRRDVRSEAAASYRHLYNTARWKRRRLAQLRDEPICRMCKAANRVTPATVADHVIPHKGDAALFFKGELQSLCDPHHNSTKQKTEARGYGVGCDAGGRPTDPGHPWNRA